MDPLVLARWQFGITTVYHFIFVPLTIGLSLLVTGMQTVWMRTGKEQYLRMTKFWGKLFLINFAMDRLQAELVTLQEWVRAEGAAGGRGLRGPATPRARQCDQAGHPVPQPPGRPHRRAARAHRTGAHPRERRFRSRLEDPMRRRKLSPMDLESVFVHTDIPEAPWYVVEARTNGERGST